jgi:hypothetical protein
MFMKKKRESSSAFGFCFSPLHLVFTLFFFLFIHLLQFFVSLPQNCLVYLCSFYFVSPPVISETPHSHTQNDETEFDSGVEVTELSTNKQLSLSHQRVKV